MPAAVVLFRHPARFIGGIDEVASERSDTIHLQYRFVLHPCEMLSAGRHNGEVSKVQRLARWCVVIELTPHRQVKGPPAITVTSHRWHEYAALFDSLPGT